MHGEGGLCTVSENPLFSLIASWRSDFGKSPPFPGFLEKLGLVYIGRLVAIPCPRASVGDYVKVTQLWT